MCIPCNEVMTTYDNHILYERHLYYIYIQPICPYFKYHTIIVHNISHVQILYENWVYYVYSQLR